MKSMCNDDGSCSNYNGWLGFSLSPQVNNMDDDHHHQISLESHQITTTPTTTTTAAVSSSSTSVPTTPTASSFFPSSQHYFQLNNIYYNGGSAHDSDQQHGSHGFFYSHHHPFPLMPLKSDGSLCIIPQGVVQAAGSSNISSGGATPKLEDFFGGCDDHHHQQTIGGSTGTHHYDYHHLHQQQQQQSSRDTIHQQYPFYPPLFATGAGALEGKEDHVVSDHLPTFGENSDEICTGVRNWVQRSIAYTGCVGASSDHHQINGGDHSSAEGGGGTLGAMGYGDLQSLSLSMSPGSQSSCVSASHQITPPPSIGAECLTMEISRKRVGERMDNQNKQIVHRKSLDTFGQRTSQYRGVTRHRWTGRYEAHLWDNSCKKEGQSRKGRQVYLGGYDTEEKAARAYDLAALKYWGPSTHINFPLEDYQQQLEEMRKMTKQEFVAHLRRKSSGFSRGASIYRGVTRHHQHGRWQARIGRVAGNKDLYLGTFSTQEEAAEAYDIAAIKFRGANAVTNFDIVRYDVDRIIASNTLLAGELARRPKELPPAQLQQPPPIDHQQSHQSLVALTATAHRDSLKDQLAQDHELVKVGAIYGSTQLDTEDPAKMGGPHFSDPSSLVTSLSSSSREGSPDKNNTNGTNKLFANPWINQANQLRPPSISLPQLPVFAAWADLH